ncbi:MAG: hypothetical protein ACE5FU_12440 [Nitrospinota bacterium]
MDVLYSKQRYVFFQTVLVLLFSVPIWAGQDVIRMTGIGPTCQVNRPDAKNRFCYDRGCILHGEGEIKIFLKKQENSGKEEPFFLALAESGELFRKNSRR